jgi:hypothetical protein
MGRIFAHWVIVCFEQFFWEIAKVTHIFWPILSTIKEQHYFGGK